MSPVSIPARVRPLSRRTSPWLHKVSQRLPRTLRLNMPKRLPPMGQLPHHARHLLHKLFPVSPRHVGLLLVRFWYEYRQLWKTQLVRDLLDRLLFLFAFGIGMGAVVPTMGGLPYLTFLTPGMAASTGLMVMSLAMTYGVYERLVSARLWPAWLATPIRLPEVVLAELIYAALRCLPSTLILLLLAGLWLHALPSFWGVIAALPVLFLANLALGAVALCFTAHIRRTLHFAYVNTLWTTPMFLFSGVFFDISHAPAAFQLLANILPLTHVINIVRPLMAGQELSLLATLGHLSYLLLLFIGGYRYALYRFNQRIFD